MGGFQVIFAFLLVAGAAAANEYPCSDRKDCTRLYQDLKVKLQGLEEELKQVDDKLAFAPGDEYESLQEQRALVLQSIKAVRIGLENASRIIFASAGSDPAPLPPGEVPPPRPPTDPGEAPPGTEPAVPPDRSREDEVVRDDPRGFPPSVLDEGGGPPSFSPGLQVLQERLERFDPDLAASRGLPAPRPGTPPGRVPFTGGGEDAHGLPGGGYDEEFEPEEGELPFRRALSPVVGGGDPELVDGEYDEADFFDDSEPGLPLRRSTEVNLAVRINNRFGGDPQGQQAYGEFAEDELVEGEALGEGGGSPEGPPARGPGGSRSVYAGNGLAVGLPPAGEGGWSDWDAANEMAQDQVPGPDGKDTVYGPPVFEAKALGQALAKAAKGQAKVGKPPKWTRKKTALAKKKRKKVPPSLWARFLHKARGWGLLPAAPAKPLRKDGEPSRELAEAFFASTSSGPPHLWAWYALGAVWLAMGLTFLAWRLRRRRGASPPPNR